MSWHTNRRRGDSRPKPTCNVGNSWMGWRILDGIMYNELQRILGLRCGFRSGGRTMAGMTKIDRSPS